MVRQGFLIIMSMHMKSCKNGTYQHNITVISGTYVPLLNIDHQHLAATMRAAQVVDLLHH